MIEEREFLYRIKCFFFKYKNLRWVNNLCIIDLKRREKVEVGERVVFLILYSLKYNG